MARGGRGEGTAAGTAPSVPLALNAPHPLPISTFAAGPAAFFLTTFLVPPAAAPVPPPILRSSSRASRLRSLSARSSLEAPPFVEARWAA